MADKDLDKKSDRAEEAKNNLSKILTDVARDFNAATGELGDVGNSLSKLVKQAHRAGVSFSEIGETIVSRLEEELKKADKAITIPNLLKQLEKHGVSKEISKVIEQLAKEQDRFIIGAKSLAQELSDELMTPFDKFIGAFEKIPGGKIFSKMFKFDEARKNIKNDITAQLVKAGKEGEISFKTLSSVGKSAFEGIGTSAKAALGHPVLLAIALIIGALYLAYKQWNKIIEAAKKIRDETGVTGKRAKDLADTAGNIAKKFTALGVDVEVAGKSIGALVNEFKNADLITEGMIENVSLMAGALGVSEQSGAKVMRLFKVMGGLSDEMSGNLMASATKMAELGGVAPSQVFEDMAQSSQEIYTFFKGNLQNVIKSAVELRRMGSSLKEAAATARNLLDFETNITAELEASVLAGTQLDLSRARWLAFNGDIAGSQKEILNQIQRINGFDKMNIIQKEAIAKASGMELTQLQNMIDQEKMLNTLRGQGRYKEYEDSIKALEDFRKANKLDIIAENQRLLVQEQFAKSWENLAYTLSSVIFPIFDAIYAMLEPISNAIQKLFSDKGVDTELFTGMKDSFKEIGQSIAEIIPPLFEIMKVIMPVLIDHVKSFIEPFKIGIQMIAKLLKGDFAGAIGMAGDFMAAVVKRILSGLYLLPKLFLTMIDKALGTNLVGAIQATINWISGAWGTLIDIILTPFRLIVSAVDALWGGLKEGWAMIYATVFKPFIDTIDWIGGAISDIGGFFSGLFGGGTATETANVPPTATGGVVTRPQVRMVGEAGPEAIIPLDKAGSFGDNSQIVSKLDELINKSDSSIITQKLDELIDAIESMSIVMDHRKVGEILATNAIHPGFG